jgi:hypothetical protein
MGDHLRLNDAERILHLVCLAGDQNARCQPPDRPYASRAGDIRDHCAVKVKSTGALVPLAIPFLVPRYWNRKPIVRGIWTMPKFIAASPD